MKVLGLLLLVAVLSLVASSSSWLVATRHVERTTANAGAVLAAFERDERPSHEVDLGERYSARRELLDPRLALPTWHEHDRTEAVVAHRASASCSPADATMPVDPFLAKAVVWERRACVDDSMPPDDLVEQAPFMHPSGRSYAMLAILRHPRASDWIRAHVRAFHVAELRAIDPSLLDENDRALAELPPSAWDGLSRGDDLVLTPESLLVAERSPLGLGRLRVYARPRWEAFAREASIALVARGASSLCATPASRELCWEGVSVAERRGPALFIWTMGSAGLLAVGSVALGIGLVRERRRQHRDRIHILRTLTHELRTPATTLRVDIEPLRAAYDAMPSSCQEPLLRVSDGIERLHRVLYRSARYMALFETDGRAAAGLVNPREIPSARDMFEGFAEEWPEGVTLTCPPEDASLLLDSEWLGVAVRNLVENAVRHGQPKVEVSWRLAGERLVVRVSDEGTSEGLSLARATAPFQRNAESSGLGLGLAIVARVATLLRGSLAHEPSPTVFELRVPCARGSA